MRTPDSEIEFDPGMKLAVEWAQKALDNNAMDPSNQLREPPKGSRRVQVGQLI
jgi:hypothetical protein